MPNTSSTPESPCGTLTEQMPQHILPPTKPSDQMLLEQDTFPAWEKSSHQLQPPVPQTPPLGPSPPQKAAAPLAGSSTHTDAQRSYELHRLTNLPGWKPKWERQNPHPWKGCYESGFAPAWQCRCSACPREASSGSSDRARQWRSWLQVALGSLLCNVQPKSQ